MLVTLKGLLEDAKNKKQAVGAFNGTTLEGIRAIIGAAEEFQRPVILQHAQSHDTIIDLNEIAPLMLHYARSASVPVAVHLDHGSTFKRCMEAIRAGFTSVMYDASAKPFEQNLMETAEIVKAAHSVGVSVEAELGHVANINEDPGEDNIYTDPALAEEFVKRTGVDCLAVVSRSFFADSSYMLSFSVLCSCVCSRLISPSVSSWHKQDNTLMHQSPGHIQRRTPYNF